MKKSLILALALVFVFAVAGTAFAAANPFVDVPADSWAYGAVADLAKAGIVDGYGDGTFRGDRTMTRYEMAQIVAKAMAKEDKANAQQKATIDKLAVEFASELNSLGVRVTKLEQNQSNLKFSGTLSNRYKAQDYDEAGRASSVAAQYRLRLDAVAKVDDNTSFGMRFVTKAPDQNGFANNSWVTYGTHNNNGYNGYVDSQGKVNPLSASENAQIDRIFFTTKIGAVSTTIGRQALAIDPQAIVVDNGFFSYDGVKLGWKLGDFNFAVNHGRFAKDVLGYAFDNRKADIVDPITGKAAWASDFANVDVDSVLVSSKVGKVNYDLGWAAFKNNSKDIDLLTYYFGNVGYTFSKNFSLAAEYGKNDEATTDGAFWTAKAVLGAQALKAKGDNNFVVQYTDAQKNSVYNPYTVLDTPGNGNSDAYKVLDLNYNYAFSKNFNSQLQYVKVDDKDAPSDKNDYNYWKLTANVKF